MSLGFIGSFFLPIQIHSPINKPIYKLINIGIQGYQGYTRVYKVSSPLLFIDNLGN